MVHAFQLLIWNDCNYPSAFAYFIGAHAVMFYFLFSNFYKRAYTVRQVSSLCPSRFSTTLNFSSHPNLQAKKDKEDKLLLANGNLESEPNKNLESHLSQTSSGYPVTSPNGKTSFYQAVGRTVEDSYSTTRHRVYVGSVNN